MSEHPQPVTAHPLSGAEVEVLVVDDQQPFRAALCALIARSHGFTLVGQASSGEEATRAVAELSPQLVLMDIVMPGMGGIAAARLILRRRPAPVVILISVDDPSLHPEAQALGDLVCFVRKQDLRTPRLEELWETRHN
jgi:DNA-binding NarL/FixJ family response regulator